MAEISQTKSRSESLWRFIGSVRFAVGLMALLAFLLSMEVLRHPKHPFNAALTDFLPTGYEFEQSARQFSASTGVWFAGILFLLALSSVCSFINQWPVMRREMADWRDQVKHSSLLLSRHNTQWVGSGEVDQLLRGAKQHLRQRGYQVQISGGNAGDSRALLCARRGMWFRSGYLFCHTGVVIICLVGLLVSPLPGQLTQWLHAFGAEQPSEPSEHAQSKSHRANFGDSATELSYKLWSLDGRSAHRDVRQSYVGQVEQIESAEHQWRVAFKGFSEININAVATGSERLNPRDMGPAVVFSQQGASGDATEFINFMQPIEVDGVPVLLSGRRSNIAEQYQYLHIPAGPDGGVQRFMALVDVLRHSDRVIAFARQTVSGGKKLSENDPRLQMANAMGKLVQLFLNRGLAGVGADIEAKVPKSKQQAVRRVYRHMLRSIVMQAYSEVLSAEGGQAQATVDSQWFDRAMVALKGLSLYGSPFYVQLQGFQQWNNNGFKLAKTVGGVLLCVGVLLLIVGVFVLLFVRPRRLWLSLIADKVEARVVFAGFAAREKGKFAQEFERLSAGLMERPVPLPAAALEKAALATSASAQH